MLISENTQKMKKIFYNGDVLIQKGINSQGALVKWAGQGKEGGALLNPIELADILKSKRRKIGGFKS